MEAIIIDILNGALAGGIYSITTAIRKKDRETGDRAQFNNKKFIRTFAIGAVLGLMSYVTGMTVDTVSQNVLFLSGATAIVENAILFISRLQKSGLTSRT